MTPDEVVQGLQEMASDCATRVAEVIDNQLDQDYHDEELKKSNTLDSAISFLQDYQKLMERVSVEKIQKILAWELSLLGKPMNDGSVPKIAQSIITYLQQPTEH